MADQVRSRPIGLSARGELTRLGFRSNDPVLLSINRFEGKKDIALAIDAFARARVEYPTLRLVLAGAWRWFDIPPIFAR